MRIRIRQNREKKKDSEATKKSSKKLIDTDLNTDQKMNVEKGEVSKGNNAG